VINGLSEEYKDIFQCFNFDDRFQLLLLYLTLFEITGINPLGKKVATLSEICRCFGYIVCEISDATQFAIERDQFKIECNFRENRNIFKVINYSNVTTIKSAPVSYGIFFAIVKGEEILQTNLRKKIDAQIDDVSSTMNFTNETLSPSKLSALFNLILNHKKQKSNKRQKN
jgi:hypothetical protein